MLMRERNISRLPPVCALTGDLARNLLVHGRCSHLLSHLMGAKISCLTLPRKKACLSAWNFTIRDSVLGLCGLPEPQLKGRIGISECGPELKKKRDCFHSF